jgi:hypothetical protein
VPMAAAWEPLSPADVREIAAYVHAHRTRDSPFEVVVFGRTSDADDTAAVAEIAEAGATWWLESWAPWDTSREEMLARIDLGPPRI